MIDKFMIAINKLRPNTQCTFYGEINNEQDFNNNVLWNTGVDSNNTAITTTTNPYSEITWIKVKEEMDKL